MTTVSFESYYDTYIFECSGHTGYAMCGEDIICSAVSVLCYTLAEHLENAEADGRIFRLNKDFREGYALIEFEVTDDSDKALFEAIDTVLDGFRLLSENYPAFIKTDF